jgi:hypothetical protein
MSAMADQDRARADDNEEGTTTEASPPRLAVPESWDAAAPRPSAAPARASGGGRGLLVGAALVGIGAATALAVFWWGGGAGWSFGGRAGAPTSAPAPTPMPAASSPPAATAAASAATRRPRAPGTTGCVLDLLPEGALGDAPPDLGYVCSEPMAHRGSLALKADLVRAGGGGRSVTPGMELWSRLGWLQLAAVAVMRAHCCPDAPASVTPKIAPKCKMDEALAWLGNALDDPEDMKRALDAFSKAAACVSWTGTAPAVDQDAPPSGAEPAQFERIYERIRAARAPVAPRSSADPRRSP